MNNHKRHGFTIVELLIVIVVIAILAAVMVVAYNGIQQNTRKSHLKSDVNAVVKAMEIFKTDTGAYPICPISGATECGFNSGADNNIRAQLLMKYTSKLPEYNFNYVRPLSDETKWAMRYRSGEAPYGFTTSGHCKFGMNMTASWYSSAPDCVAI